MKEIVLIFCFLFIFSFSHFFKHIFVKAYCRKGAALHAMKKYDEAEATYKVRPRCSSFPNSRPLGPFLRSPTERATECLCLFRSAHDFVGSLTFFPPPSPTLSLVPKRLAWRSALGTRRCSPQSKKSPRPKRKPNGSSDKVVVQAWSNLR
jgi:hypothetical protein